MDETLPKYRFEVKRQAEGWTSYAERLTTFAVIGYKVHSISFDQDIALLSLSSSNKYTDISNLKDVPPNEVDELLADGWIVADSYSKFLRMVKPIEA